MQRLDLIACKRKGGKRGANLPLRPIRKILSLVGIRKVERLTTFLRRVSTYVTNIASES